MKLVNREMGDLQARMKMAEKHIDHIKAMHNSKHPNVR